jgi:BASS family bile acid:Na+ symporter
VILVRLFNFRPTVEIVLIALAVSPVPPILPQRERQAGGHSAYAIGLMAMLALLSVVISPLAVQIMGWIFNRPLAIAPAAVARVAVMSVLAPLAAGAIVHAAVPKVAASIEKPVALLARVLLPLVVLILLVAAAPAMWELLGDGTLVAMILFQIIAFATGHLLGGPDPHHSIVLALSTACRHPAIALTIAAANFPAQRFGGAVLLYTFVAFITATPYIAWQRRRLGAAPAPVSTG